MPQSIIILLFLDAISMPKIKYNILGFKKWPTQKIQPHHIYMVKTMTYRKNPEMLVKTDLDRIKRMLRENKPVNRISRVVRASDGGITPRTLIVDIRDGIRDTEYFFRQPKGPHRSKDERMCQHCGIRPKHNGFRYLCLHCWKSVGCGEMPEARAGIPFIET